MKIEGSCITGRGCFLLTLVLISIQFGACDTTTTPPDPVIVPPPPIISTTTVPELLAASCERLLSSPLNVYVHHDHRDSVTFESTHSGESVGRVSYGPFGQTLKDPEANNHYRFSGQEMDRSTESIQFKYRSFDPLSGRWLSPDPLFTPVTIDHTRKYMESITSVFAYVANAPINATDPLGLAPRTLRARVRRQSASTRSRPGLRRSQSSPNPGRHLRTGMPRHRQSLRRHDSDTRAVERLARNSAPRTFEVHSSRELRSLLGVVGAGDAAESRPRTSSPNKAVRRVGPARSNYVYWNLWQVLHLQRRHHQDDMHRRLTYGDSYNRARRSFD